MKSKRVCMLLLVLVIVIAGIVAINVKNGIMGKAEGAPLKSSLLQTRPSRFLPVNITIITLNQSGDPLSGIRVYGINHEFYFREKGVTNSRGKVVFQGIPGTWSFFATLDWGKALSQKGQGYAPCVVGINISNSSEIILQPNKSLTINLNPLLPNFTGINNIAVYLIEPNLGPALGLDTVGILSNNRLTVALTENMNARVGFVVGPMMDSPGLFYLGEPMIFNKNVTITIKSHEMGKIIVKSFDRENEFTPYHIQIQCFQRSWDWNPWIADMPTGPHVYYCSPGDYLFLRGVDIINNSKRYRILLNPIALSVDNGKEYLMCMGSPSSYKVLVTPEPAPGFGSYTQLFLDIRDDFGNQVTDAWEIPGNRRAPHVIVNTSNRSIEGDMGFGFACKLEGIFEEEENPQYEVTWNFGPHGNGTLQGKLYDRESLEMYIHHTNRLVPQSPAINYSIHSMWANYYENIAEEMEKLIGVPTDYPIGVIENIMHAGFKDEILHGFKIELPLELIADPNWRGGQLYHAHEEGHGRIHKPPCNFWAINLYFEAYATVMGYESTAAIANCSSYIKYLYGSHDLFLRHLHGEPIEDVYDEIEIIQFITYYLRQNYGFQIHRRMILEWNNAFKPLRNQLSQLGYSNLEQFVAIYSHLANNTNLAWIFNEGGLYVNESKIENAMSSINQEIFSDKIKLKIGESNAICDMVSVPIMIRRVQPPGFNDIQITISYNVSKATPIAVYKRDLTYSPKWQLVANYSGAGKINISLHSSNLLINDVGSIAQINFKIASNITGFIHVNITSAMSPNATILSNDGGIWITPSPTITTLPPLYKGYVGSLYKAQLTGLGGRPPYQWDIVRFELPPGLTLNHATGSITGIPLVPGRFQFKIEMKDKNNITDQRWIIIPVSNETLPNVSPLANFSYYPSYPSTSDIIYTLRAGSDYLDVKIKIDLKDPEIFGEPEGDLLIVSWGSTYGTVYTAMEEIQNKGLKVSWYHMRWINPLPKNLGTYIKNFKKVLVPEINLGQLIKVLRAEYLVDAVGFNQVKGLPLNIGDLVETIESQVKGL